MTGALFLLCSCGSPARYIDGEKLLCYYCYAELGTSKAIRLGLVACAIKHGTAIFTLPKPARHHNIISHMIKNNIRPPINTGMGFLNERNQFMDRFDAEKYAKDVGQITGTIGSVLTSEDLW